MFSVELFYVSHVNHMKAYHRYGCFLLPSMIWNGWGFGEFVVQGLTNYSNCYEAIFASQHILTIIIFWMLITVLSIDRCTAVTNTLFGAHHELSFGHNLQGVK